METVSSNLLLLFWLTKVEVGNNNKKEKGVTKGHPANQKIEIVNYTDFFSSKFWKKKTNLPDKVKCSKVYSIFLYQ